MVAAEVAALAARYQLADRAGSRLDALVALISDDARAPTTVREPRKIVADHLADSLAALELPEVLSAATVVDIGSGAGFPGLPLAIALSGAEVVLLEASVRKCAYIADAIAALGLENTTVVHRRAESWPEGHEAFDLATARAVGSLALVAEYAAPLLSAGGSLVVWRGRRAPEEESAASSAAAELGLEVRAPVRVQPYPSAQHRHLHAMTKVRRTPSRFPRRPGVARKRPLAGAWRPTSS
jgi:16S rRNA (guanine527-N7)-methyltransferase